ncbi:MAG: hypothetical protein RMK99_10685, partial [Anaerolineales bacterium]|nr:hypothetical protein [Anaerolineales bacterium]
FALRSFRRLKSLFFSGHSDVLCNMRVVAIKSCARSHCDLQTKSFGKLLRASDSAFQLGQSRSTIVCASARRAAELSNVTAIREIGDMYQF